MVSEASEVVRIQLRIPPELSDRIEAAYLKARKNDRTVDSKNEFVRRLLGEAMKGKR